MDTRTGACLLLLLWLVTAETDLKPGEEGRRAPVCLRIRWQDGSNSAFYRHTVDSFQICRCIGKAKAACGAPLPSAERISDTADNEADAIAGYCKKRTSAGGVCLRGRERSGVSIHFCDCAINSTDFERIFAEISGTDVADPFGQFSTETATRDQTLLTTPEPPSGSGPDSETVTTPTPEVTTQSDSQTTAPMTEQQAFIHRFRAEALCQKLHSNQSDVSYKTFRRTFTSSWTECRCQNEHWAVCEPDKQYPTVKPGTPSAVLAAEKAPAHTPAGDQALLISGLFALQQLCRQSALAGEVCATQDAGLRSSCDCARDVKVSVADVPPELLPTLTEALPSEVEEGSTETTPATHVTVDKDSGATSRTESSVPTESGTVATTGSTHPSVTVQTNTPGLTQPTESDVTTSVEDATNASSENTSTSDQRVEANICSRLGSEARFTRTTFSSDSPCICVTDKIATCKRQNMADIDESTKHQSDFVSSAQQAEYQQSGLENTSVMKKHRKLTEQLYIHGFCQSKLDEGLTCEHKLSRDEESTCDCQVEE